MASQYEVSAIPDPDQPGKVVSKEDSSFEEKKDRWEEKVSSGAPSVYSSSDNSSQGQSQQPNP